MSKRKRCDRRRKKRQERLRQERHRQKFGRPEDRIGEPPGRRARPGEELEGGPPDRAEGHEEFEEERFAPPSPFMMERHIRQFERAIDEREFDGPEEIKAFLDSEFVGRRIDDGPLPGDPKDRAQDLAYRAMEEKGPFEARALARRAVKLDPDCVDALAVLASIEAGTDDERIELTMRAVEAGERSLGEEFFKENRGRFWGIVETRPYMRVKQGLADLLWEAGREDEAIRHYEEMLELNPNDNQGNRHTLVGFYLAAGDLEGARRLFDQFSDDASAAFAWARVIERFVAGDGKGASEALEAARKRNPHVEAYVTGARRLPDRTPEYYERGRESEAVVCVRETGEAWHRHPEALQWLKDAGSAG